MATLIIKDGPLAGQRVDVGGEMSLGREAADLVIDDPEISRRHAALRPAEGGTVIEDLGSTNGTFVNGNRITAPTRLSPGDTVRIGRTTLEVQAPPAGARSTVQAPAWTPGQTQAPPAAAAAAPPAQVSRPAEQAPVQPQPQPFPGTGPQYVPPGQEPTEKKPRFGALRQAKGPKEHKRSWAVIAGAAGAAIVVALVLFFILFAGGDDFAAAADEECRDGVQRLNDVRGASTNLKQADRRDLQRVSGILTDVRGDITRLEGADEGEARRFLTAFAAMNRALENGIEAKGGGRGGVNQAQEELTAEQKQFKEAADDAGVDTCARLANV